MVLIAEIFGGPVQWADEYRPGVNGKGVLQMAHYNHTLVNRYWMLLVFRSPTRNIRVTRDTTRGTVVQEPSNVAIREGVEIVCACHGLPYRYWECVHLTLW